MTRSNISLCGTLLSIALMACGGDEMDPPVGNTNNSSFNNSAPECTEATDLCTGEKVCVAGVCEEAFNRFYRLIIRNGELPAVKPGGGLWDEGTDEERKPDAYVEIFADGVRLGRTSTIRDNWFPEWNEQVDVRLLAGSSIRMTLFDEDIIADDEVFTCVADPLTPSLLRGRNLTCGGNDMEDLYFNVRLEPKT